MQFRVWVWVGGGGVKKYARYLSTLIIYCALNQSEETRDDQQIHLKICTSKWSGCSVDATLLKARAHHHYITKGNVENI